MGTHKALEALGFKGVLVDGCAMYDTPSLPGFDCQFAITDGRVFMLSTLDEQTLCELATKSGMSRDEFVRLVETNLGVRSMPNDFKTVAIVRKDAQDVTFHGRLVASISSRDETRQDGREKTRWTELQLWELPSGKWIAANVGRSEREGEMDVGEIREIDRREDKAAMQFDAMAFWGWTWLAKTLAGREGWDVVRRID